jgi:uncharacterized protein (DUF927 family)
MDLNVVTTTTKFKIRALDNQGRVKRTRTRWVKSRALDLYHLWANYFERVSEDGISLVTIEEIECKKRIIGTYDKYARI